MKNPIKHLRCGIFATRDTPDEAMVWAQNLILTLDEKDRIPALTALQVVVNSIVDEVERNVN